MPRYTNVDKLLKNIDKHLESKTIVGAFIYHQKAIFANDIVERIFIEDEVENG